MKRLATGPEAQGDLQDVTLAKANGKSDVSMGKGALGGCICG